MLSSQRAVILVTCFPAAPQSAPHMGISVFSVITAICLALRELSKLIELLNFIYFVSLFQSKTARISKSLCNG